MRAESEAAEKQQAAAAAASAAKRPSAAARTDDKDASKRRKVGEPVGVAAAARGAEEAKPATAGMTKPSSSTSSVPKVEGSKPLGVTPAAVPAATRVGVPKPPGSGVATTTIASKRTVTTISRPTTPTITPFGGTSARSRRIERNRRRV